jgi:hypothetical protein
LLLLFAVDLSERLGVAVDLREGEPLNVPGVEAEPVGEAGPSR